LTVVVAAAQSQRSPLSLVPPNPTIRLVQQYVESGDGINRIVGAVIDSRRLPIANGRVQLRSLVNGRIVMETKADEGGEFTFAPIDAGTYVAELTIFGAVQGVSDAATLSGGELAQVLIQLQGQWNEGRQQIEREPTLAQYFGARAIDTMTGATMTTAANQGIRPVDSGEPVSGQ
jgi:hypothetical protein